MEDYLENFIQLFEKNDIKIKPSQRLSWKPDEMNTALALALAEIEGVNKLNLRKGPFALRKNWETHRDRYQGALVLPEVLLP